MRSRQKPTLESRLAQTIIGRIERFREGKTDLASLILELHLFVETYDSGRPELAVAIQKAWSDLAEAVTPYIRDPGTPPLPDQVISAHLVTIEELLRQI